MVALMLVSVGLWLPGAGAALCTCFPRPDFHRLGPPPRPPGLNLPCNGSECCKALVSLSTDGAGYTGAYEATSETTLLVRPDGPVLSTTVSAGAADAATPRTASAAWSPGTPPPLTGLLVTASQGGLPTGPSDTGAGQPNLNHPSSPPTASTSTINTQTYSVASLPTAQRPPHDKAVAVTSSSSTSHKSMPNSQTVVPPNSLTLATTASSQQSGGISGHGGGSMQKGSAETVSHLPFNGSTTSHDPSSPLTSVVTPTATNDNNNNKGRPGQPSQSQTRGAKGDAQPPAPSNHQKPHSSPLPIGASGPDGHVTSSAPSSSANQTTDNNSPSENSTANPFGVGRSLGNYGLAAGELAAIGLGVVLVVLILLLLSIYWKKRYKGRVTPTPMKEETNYLHNYRVRGWAWRPAPNGPSPDDIERSDDKRALITSPVTSHLSLSSGSIDAGYGGGDTPLQGGPPTGGGHRHRNSGGTPGEGGGRDLCCSVSKYVLKTESSMSSGIGLSQGDLQESEVDDLVSYNPDRVLHMMNGGCGDGGDDEETHHVGRPNGRPVSVPPRSSSLPGGGAGRQNVLRSQSNNTLRDKPLPAKNGYHHHFGGHRHRSSSGGVHKSTSSPNRLDRPASYDSILEDANETWEAHPRGNLPLHGTTAYRPLSQTDTTAFPILEAIRGPRNNGVPEVTSASNDYTDGVPEVASYTSLPATHHYQDASTAVRGLSHSATASPDHTNHKHKKRRKKRKHHAKSEADALDQVAMDTIINTLPPPQQGLTRLTPVGSSPRGERNGYSKNGESVA